MLNAVKDFKNWIKSDNNSWRLDYYGHLDVDPTVIKYVIVCVRRENKISMYAITHYCGDQIVLTDHIVATIRNAKKIIKSIQTQRRNILTGTYWRMGPRIDIKERLYYEY